MNTPSLPNDPPLILVVDDDKMTRLLLCQRLEQQGYKVVEASNGLECLASFKSLQPQIILLAAMMPVMDGFTCCTHLRSLPESAHTPVLIITEDDQNSINQAFAVGATDYITKPFNWVVLIHHMRRLVEQSQLYQQLKAANQKLQSLTGRDDLTQVANRQRFNESFDQEWRRMGREVLPLALIICDIDFFKLYKEIYGYQAGDKCLKTVADLISRIAKRPADLVARYGDEEFAVILPYTQESGAIQVANKIREKVKSLNIIHTGSPIGQYVTLSLGVSSTFPHFKTLPETLIAAAEQALYQAKKAGGDRVLIEVCDD